MLYLSPELDMPIHNARMMLQNNSNIYDQWAEFKVATVRTLPGARSTEIYLRMPLVSTSARFEASKRVTNGVHLGCSLLLPVHAVNYVETLKAPNHLAWRWTERWVPVGEGIHTPVGVVYAGQFHQRIDRIA
jgi:hypothetical protein